KSPDGSGLPGGSKQGIVSSGIRHREPCQALRGEAGGNLACGRRDIEALPGNSGGTRLPVERQWRGCARQQPAALLYGTAASGAEPLPLPTLSSRGEGSRSDVLFPG